MKIIVEGASTAVYSSLVTEEAAPTNAPPAFISQPLTSLAILAEIGEDGEWVNDSRFKYRTPRAEDPEGDTIYFEFSGIPDELADVIWAIDKEDGSFMVKVERSKITAENIGTYTLQVKMEDRKSDDTVSLSIAVDI